MHHAVIAPKFRRTFLTDIYESDEVQCTINTGTHKYISIAIEAFRPPITTATTSWHLFNGFLLRHTAYVLSYRQFRQIIEDYLYEVGRPFNYRRTILIKHGNGVLTRLQARLITFRTK